MAINPHCGKLNC